MGVFALIVPLLQVVLVRSEADRARLPRSVQASNALIMPVISSKGLEFEDVLLVDFISSLEDAKAWRTLLSYLHNVLENHPAVAAAAGAGGEGKGRQLLEQVLLQVRAWGAGGGLVS